MATTPTTMHPAVKAVQNLADEHEKALDLLDAALLYVQLTGKQFPEVTGLIAWSVVRFPDILVEGAFKEQITGLVPQGFNPDNYQFLLMAIDLLAKADLLKGHQ